MQIDLDPEMPFRVAGAHYMLAQCGKLAKHIPGVRLGEDPEELHDVRVASRRLRSAMLVFRSCFTPGQYRRWYSLVSELADALSDARDQDVQAGLIGRLREDLPSDQQAVIDAWLSEQSVSRQEARAKMIAVLDQWESDGALEGLRGAFEVLAGDAVAEGEAAGRATGSGIAHA